MKKKKKGHENTHIHRGEKVATKHTIKDEPADAGSKQVDEEITAEKIIEKGKKKKRKKKNREGKDPSDILPKPARTPLPLSSPFPQRFLFFPSPIHGRPVQGESRLGKTRHRFFVSFKGEGAKHGLVLPQNSTPCLPPDG